MSTPQPRLYGPIRGTHPAILDRRIRQLLQTGAAGLILVAIAVGVTTRVPHPNLPLSIAAMLSGLGVLALMVSTRYEVTLALVALYLGLLDGPVKLISGAGSTASASRDVLICAISLGVVLRLLAKRERVKLPPLSGWVLAFVALVLVEAFNPGTHGILKVLGGFRQQLEWIPFFCFGYLIMRSKERFRQLFLLLGLIALLNGLVSTYQTRITPTQLAGWGSGYHAYVNGGKGLSAGGAGLTGRTYFSEGVARVRPPALGSDEGFGGSVGVLALPGLLALLATGRLRRRWVAPLLCVGAVLAIATSLQRTQVLGSVAVVVGFALLSISAERRALRPLMALLAVVAIAFALGAVLSSAEGKGTFSRYLSITPSRAGSTTVNYREKTLLQIPKDIASAPFGVGLATVGAAAGFGEHAKVEIEGQGASGESQYNYVTLELGLPGLLLWIALSIRLIVLGVRGVRRVGDSELRLSLAAVFAAVIAFTLVGLAGPTMASPPFGPYFWFAAGIAAYWFAGPGRAACTPIRAGTR
jgi:hypothetical protein